MVDRSGKLTILEDDYRDYNLPKYKQEVTGRDAGADDSTRRKAPRRWGPRFNDSNENVMAASPGRLKLWFVVLSWLSRAYDWIRDVKTSRPQSVREFFLQVKGGTVDIKVLEGHAEMYKASINHARMVGQEALAESLEALAEEKRAEALMVASGIAAKYVTESSLAALAPGASRKLRLDYVKNFTRAIPDELIQLKKHADELGIFDNYAVLHYDPKNQSASPTKADVAAMRDPILFGLVWGSRNLYYLGDWEDEYCDLTLDKLVGLLAERGIKPVQDIQRPSEV